MSREPRARDTASIAAALATEPSASVATLPEDPKDLPKGASEAVDMGRPTADYGVVAESFSGIDEVAELERILSDETPDDRIAMFDKLSPKAKEIFLTTFESDPLENTLQNDILFIDKKAVPEKLHLHWVSSWIAGEIGWRGLLKVPNNAETRKWAPRLRPHPSQPFMQAGRMFLCFRSKREWLIDRLAELKEAQATREDALKEFAPALRSRYAELGISKTEAEALEKELGGVLRNRGPEPTSTSEPENKE